LNLQDLLMRSGFPSAKPFSAPLNQGGIYSNTPWETLPGNAQKFGAIGGLNPSVLPGGNVLPGTNTQLPGFSANSPGLLMPAGSQAPGIPLPPTRPPEFSPSIPGPTEVASNPGGANAYAGQPKPMATPGIPSAGMSGRTLPLPPPRPGSAAASLPGGGGMFGASPSEMSTMLDIARGGTGNGAPPMGGAAMPSLGPLANGADVSKMERPFGGMFDRGLLGMLSGAGANKVGGASMPQQGLLSQMFNPPPVTPMDAPKVDMSTSIAGAAPPQAPMQGGLLGNIFPFFFG
jgi:hypothetical protein